MFVPNVLMLDCSEGSISVWHVLGTASWQRTPGACVGCANAPLEEKDQKEQNKKKALMLNELKSFVGVSNASWKKNKAVCSHCTRYYKARTQDCPE